MTQQNQIQQPNTTRRIRRGLAVAGLSLAPFALLAAPGVADQHNPMIKTAAAETAGGSSDEDRSFSGAAYDAFLEGRLVTAYTVNRNLNPFDLSVDVKNQKATIGGAVETEASGRWRWKSPPASTRSPMWIARSRSRPMLSTRANAAWATGSTMPARLRP